MYAVEKPSSILALMRAPEGCCENLRILDMVISRIPHFISWRRCRASRTRGWRRRSTTTTPGTASCRRWAWSPTCWRTTWWTPSSASCSRCALYLDKGQRIKTQTDLYLVSNTPSAAALTMKQYKRESLNVHVLERSSGPSQVFLCPNIDLFTPWACGCLESWQPVLWALVHPGECSRYKLKGSGVA